MRISDWSSDVCSSDLDGLAALGELAGQVRGERGLADAAFLIEQGDDHARVAFCLQELMETEDGTTMAPGCSCAPDRPAPATVMLLLLEQLPVAQVLVRRGFFGCSCRSDEHTSELPSL